MHRHVCVFVDESGDLGFSCSASRYVVAVALATVMPIEIRRLVRRAQSRFGPTENRLGELKFNTASTRLRLHVLEGIARTETWIAWNALLKPSLPECRKTDKEGLLNSLRRVAVSELTARIHARKVSIVVDKRRVREKTREGFDNEVRSAVMARHLGFFPPEVSISHFDSQTSEGLQAADFVAGAVYRSLERLDDTYLDVIRPKVVFSDVR